MLIKSFKTSSNIVEVVGCMMAGEVRVCPVPGNQQSRGQSVAGLQRQQEDVSIMSGGGGGEQNIRNIDTALTRASNEGSRRLRDDFTITEG